MLEDTTQALLTATLIGTALQVAMVLAGHRSKKVADLFAVGGMGISLLAGVLYVIMGHPDAMATAAAGGAIAGGVCAFIGILVSYLLKDVPASLLALGTLSSVVTGAIGGALAHWLG
ncbi:MAG TPA: hypothetical protein VFQ45_05045 [Longimicrobium sp.]|nr:hypothetical protein [Longimicrobium sp.]